MGRADDFYFRPPTPTLKICLRLDVPRDLTGFLVLQT